MMKYTFTLLLCLALSPGLWADELEGVWELVAGEYVNQDGELVDYQSVDLKAIKILSEAHFSFTAMKGDDFWASGSGTYEVTGGQYIESLQYNSFGEKAGARFTFETTIEKDRWYNSRWDGEERVEYEVWHRVK